MYSNFQFIIEVYWKINQKCFMCNDTNYTSHQLYCIITPYTSISNKPNERTNEDIFPINIIICCYFNRRTTSTSTLVPGCGE